MTVKMIKSRNTING